MNQELTEKHHSFIPYNKIITYRNVEHSMLNLFSSGLKPIHNLIYLSWFFPFYNNIFLNTKMKL